MLAYFLHDLSPFIYEFRPGMGLRWYGLAYVCSFLIGGWMYRWLARGGYTDMPEEQVSDFITWSAVFGVMIGGRLGWAIFYGGRGVWEDPLSVFRVWDGGMASHGGILGMILFTYYWSWKKGVSWTSIGDSLVVVAPVGLFLVRLANFVNGELYGRATTVLWAVLFPQELGMNEPSLREIREDPAVRERLREILVARHPSQIYEAILEGLVLLGVLWWMRVKCRVPRGGITGTFFILYAVLRIIGECFRVPDPAWSALGLSAGQFLSTFMVLIGVSFWVGAWRRPEYERVFRVEGKI